MEWAGWRRPVLGTGGREFKSRRPDQPQQGAVVYAPGMSDTSPSDPPRPVERVSTAIRTVPNAVTLARLLLMPLCAYLLATGRFGWGIALTAVVGSTDWVDGWLARRTGQVSRLGQLLDRWPTGC